MSLKEIPTVQVDFDNSEFKKERIDELCRMYHDIVGSSVNHETVGEIFHLIRLFNQYDVSPLLFFSLAITGKPRSEYNYQFKLEPISFPMATVPISLLNVIEYTIFQMSYIPRILNIKFNPFEIEWEDIREYECVMNFFMDNKLDDIRYDWYITIQWY